MPDTDLTLADATGAEPTPDLSQAPRPADAVEEDLEDEDDEDAWDDLFGAPAEDRGGAAAADEAAPEVEPADDEDDDEAASWALAVTQAAGAFPTLDGPALGQGLREALSHAEPGDTLHVVWAPGGPASSVLLLLATPPTDLQLAGLLQAIGGPDAAPPPGATASGTIVGTLCARDGKLLFAFPDPEDARLVASLTGTWGRFVPQLATCRRVRLAPAPGAGASAKPAAPLPPAPDPAPLIAALKALDGEVRAHLLSPHGRAFAAPALPAFEVATLSPIDGQRVRGPLDRASASTDRLLRTVRQLHAAASSPARRALLEASMGSATALAHALAALRSALPT